MYGAFPCLLLENIHPLAVACFQILVCPVLNMLIVIGVLLKAVKLVL
jgi:hypothetical protein